ncbi:hypothetical protein PT974_09287 [Cladobotryum mycophilum]|uniref:Tautomerase cis-CaaD-like domain-containing protein n=1 Tax=Cladobotryum mycophilum TaxID=491253 RepID=A0ABR0SFR4_9HYPO
MPLYDIEHVIPLTLEQQTSIAQAFTATHAKRFKTPSFFINVRFTDASTQVVFRGGVLRKYNRAILRTRTGEGRPSDLYNEHCRDLIRLWAEMVRSEGERELRTVWVLGALTTAVEDGFERPKVGEEIEWLKKNKDEFRRLAEAGDEDMQGLMEELRTRPEFADV